MHPVRVNTNYSRSPDKSPIGNLQHSQQCLWKIPLEAVDVIGSKYVGAKKPLLMTNDK
ncbi:hypothetical protein LC605_18410 [Nostoc sp. CHAB 5836]|uniref:hypothetical protein n=1 Tax=Nostoc sp. CHAB 5836 TaxID=2780404 RepID=UPI001E5711C3|nr:hypothetical protein [Nostoc sp. CHAB 5836]MCC5617016.1 hypothetical protein [Nostoc sp. CHAB 5836]